MIDGFFYWVQNFVDTWNVQNESLKLKQLQIGMRRVSRQSTYLTARVKKALIDGPIHFNKIPGYGSILTIIYMNLNRLEIMALALK